MLSLLGFVNYTSNFYKVFTTKSKMVRKISDFIGFFIFLANVYINLAIIRPLEVEIGNLFFATDADSSIFFQLHSNLFRFHIITGSLSFLMLIQSTISWAFQTKVEKVDGKKNN